MTDRDQDMVEAVRLLLAGVVFRGVSPEARGRDDELALLLMQRIRSWLQETSPLP